MAGGHATSSGVIFQNEVGAWIASLILTERATSNIGPRVPLNIQLEALTPVDDIVVSTRDFGRWFINVKTSVAVSERENSGLYSVFDQFVRQWLSGCSDESGGLSHSRPLDPNLDRLVLVVREGRNRSFLDAVTPVLQRLADGLGNGWRTPIAITASEITVFATLCKLVRMHWLKQVGSEAEEEDVRRLLSTVRCLEFELGGTARTAIEEGLAYSVSSESGAALDALVAICGSFAIRRSGGGPELLRSELRARGIPLLSMRQFQPDIARLRLISSRVLDDLERYGRINATDASGDHVVRVARHCVAALIKAALRGSFLLVGDPGAGKSGALHAAAVQLGATGTEVVVLAVDQLTGSTPDLLRSELGLANPIVEILSEWVPASNAVLFVDALDATRGGSSEAAFSQLLREIKARAPHWNVVASIRKFDLRYGVKFHGIFDGTPVDADYSDSDFADVAHLNVPQLTDEEIADVCTQWRTLDEVLSASAQQFRQLLRSPFNLYLLAQILGRSTVRENTAKTQLDLLRQYWRFRVEYSDPATSLRNLSLLNVLVDSMLADRRLSSSSLSIPPSQIDDLSRMLKEGVLHQPRDSMRVNFAHHMLFDFSLAKIKLIGDGPDSIGAKVRSVAEEMLLIAPAAMLAFRMAWETESTRATFWRVAIDLVGDSSTGAFIRSLPAKVAVEATQSIKDVEPLLALTSLGEKSHAADFLVKHMFGVLLAGVVKGAPRFGNDADPWIPISEAICVQSMDAFVWPMNAVISQWSGRIDEMTQVQKTMFGHCSRLLLSSQLHSPEFYNAGAVSAAVGGVIKTYSTSPSESAAILREMLQPERVAARGHNELFWFANNFKSLAEQDSGFAGLVVRSAFGTPLPSSDEPTSIGSSRIMSLTSNKRQDFEGVLHLLQRHIGWFLKSYPNDAAPAIRSILENFEQEGYRSASEVPTVARILQNEVVITPDASFIWWSYDSRHHTGKSALLEEVVKALKEDLGKADLSSFRLLVSGLINGSVSASSVAALLRAMISNAQADLELATDLLSSPAVLRMTDTTYLAGELLKIAYPMLSQQQREVVEAAILQIEDAHVRATLAGCLAMELIGNPELANFADERTRGDGLPENHPHFSISTRWGDAEAHWWLKSEGVDVTTPVAKDILDRIEAVETKDLPSDKEEAFGQLQTRWPQAIRLLAQLEDAAAIHEQLRSQAADAVAEICGTICDRCESEQDLARFEGLREAIHECLSPILTPLPVRDEEQEKQFESHGGWGRPAPRIPAAGALMAYIRANSVASPSDAMLVRQLARDPAVAVRHTIMSRANVVCMASPELARELARIAFEEERNAGVKAFFLGSFRHYLGRDVAWEAAKILELERSLPSESKGTRGDLHSQVVSLIVTLWLTWNVKVAGDRLFEWARAPMENVGSVSELIGDLRALVTFGDPATPKPEEDALRLKGLQIFELLVASLATAHATLLERAKAGEADISVPLTECTRLLDAAAHQLYFGSGAYALSHENDRSQERPGDDARKRFLNEYSPTLRLLTRIPYPSITHPVLETIEALIQDGPAQTLELLFEAVREGGKQGGYAFESLGADLVVKIVRRFLADYPSLITGSHLNRQGIVEVLDVFADNGWPEARKLVYELPEMLR